jgi:hypothetical protein
MARDDSDPVRSLTDGSGSARPGAMTKLARARWWTLRRAHNRKPATYRCPLCGNYLPALSEHMLIVPEGDASRRRHAHFDCVAAARRAGRLPTRDEWLQNTGQRAPSLTQRASDAIGRLLGRGR